MSRVWKYGDNINTDVLYPGRHLANIDPKYQAEHALEDLDPLFAKNVKPGDIVVGGKFFGCGSSREQAVTCLKYAGVPFVVAQSFARIYYRNAINNGLPPLVSPEASQKIQPGDEVEADLAGGTIRNKTRQETYRFEPFPEFLLTLLQAGGLIPYLRQQVLLKQ
jgi:3-isopropylmalate/(R)-2-methylmalate dehydratase small subunit